MKTCAIPNGGGFMAQHRHIGAQVFTQTHTHTHARARGHMCTLNVETETPTWYGRIGCQATNRCRMCTHIYMYTLNPTPLKRTTQSVHSAPVWINSTQDKPLGRDHADPPPVNVAQELHGDGVVGRDPTSSAENEMHNLAPVQIPVVMDLNREVAFRT